MKLYQVYLQNFDSGFITFSYLKFDRESKCLDIMVKLQVGREVYEDSVLFDLSSVFYFSGLELSIECELRYREIMEEVCYTSLRRVGGEVFGVCGDEGGFHIIKEKADKGCVYEIEWDSIVEEKIQYRSHDEKVLLSMKSWFYMLVFKLHERGVLAGR